MKIIVHPGRAHADDFLSACLLIYLNPIADLYRQNFTEDNLSNKFHYVIDQGLKFEPENNNFDHHHIDKDICAFTMLLDHFYGDLRAYFPWIRFIETYDAQGPSKAAGLCKMSPDKLGFVYSPIQGALLDIFGKYEGHIEKTEPIYKIMVKIGESIHNNISDIKEQMELITNGYKIIEVAGCKVLDIISIGDKIKDTEFNPPTDIWCKINKISPDIILTVNKRGGAKYRMIRVKEGKIKFKPKKYADFVHITGFLINFDDLSLIDEIIKDSLIDV